MKRGKKGLQRRSTGSAKANIGIGSTRGNAERREFPVTQPASPFHSNQILPYFLRNITETLHPCGSFRVHSLGSVSPTDEATRFDAECKTVVLNRSINEKYN